MDLGLEEGYKAGLAEFLMVLGANDERPVDVAESTWCRWHACLLALTSGGEAQRRLTTKVESCSTLCFPASLEV